MSTISEFSVTDLYRDGSNTVVPHDFRLINAYSEIHLLKNATKQAIKHFSKSKVSQTFTIDVAELSLFQKLGKCFFVIFEYKCDLQRLSIKYIERDCY